MKLSPGVTSDLHREAKELSQGHNVPNMSLCPNVRCYPEVQLTIKIKVMLSDPRSVIGPNIAVLTLSCHCYRETGEWGSGTPVTTHLVPNLNPFYCSPVEPLHPSSYHYSDSVAYIPRGGSRCECDGVDGGTWGDGGTLCALFSSSSITKCSSMEHQYLRRRDFWRRWLSERQVCCLAAFNMLWDSSE